VIAIIDCEIGNLRSVQKAFEAIGKEARITDSIQTIEGAQAVVLPGVGAFKDAIDSIRQKGLDKAIMNIIDSGTPFLGICIGLQLYATESDEGGKQTGLDIIKGRVVRLPDIVKVPEMGWNRLNVRKDCPIFKDIPETAYFYFAHSFYIVPEETDVIAATTDYGLEYVSAVWKDNIYGVQFHPEKSGKWGLKMLENFAGLAESRD